MKRLLRKHEAAHPSREALATLVWSEAHTNLSVSRSPRSAGSLHRTKSCFIFHAPKVRFIATKNEKAVQWTAFGFGCGVNAREQLITVPAKCLTKTGKQAKTIVNCFCAALNWNKEKCSEAVLNAHFDYISGRYEVKLCWTRILTMF